MILSYPFSNSNAGIRTFGPFPPGWRPSRLEMVGCSNAIGVVAVSFRIGFIRRKCQTALEFGIDEVRLIVSPTDWQPVSEFLGASDVQLSSHAAILQIDPLPSRLPSEDLYLVVHITNSGRFGGVLSLFLERVP